MLEPTTGTGGGSSHDISVLNGLIETTIDSVDGYRRSAQEATSSRFSSQFLERANEREQVVSKLREAVRSMGGNPEDDGSVLASAHRAFLSLKDKVTGSDDKAIVSEVDHGETYLAGKWEAALKDEGLSQQARSIVQQCYDSVREGADTFRRLNEDLSGGSSSSSVGTSSTGGSTY
ncbi:MAG TPA: PA2169 family four-helix-bundle protein [Allosphingosinicella sp.]|jgi:uncharacterized protein (TIGR02284 family)